MNRERALRELRDCEIRAPLPKSVVANSAPDVSADIAIGRRVDKKLSREIARVGARMMNPSGMRAHRARARSQYPARGRLRTKLQRLPHLSWHLSMRLRAHFGH